MLKCIDDLVHVLLAATHEGPGGGQVELGLLLDVLVGEAGRYELPLRHLAPCPCLLPRPQEDAGGEVPEAAQLIQFFLANDLLPGAD